MQTQVQKWWAVLVPLSFGLPTGHIRSHPFTIGRHLQCDLVLAELQISRKHATISFKTSSRGSSFTIVCHSKNHMYINNQRVTDTKSKALNDGDQIWLSKGREGPRHRPIGFVFKVGNADAETTLFTKYETQLNLLEEFVTNVKKILHCSRCSKFMAIPINANPCSHKLCQQCARKQVELNENTCKKCKHQIVSFFYDAKLASVVQSYLRYKANSEYTPSTINETDFCSQPYIFKLPPPEEANSDSRGTIEGKQKKGRRVKWLDQMSDPNSKEDKQDKKKQTKVQLQKEGQPQREAKEGAERSPSRTRQISISLPSKEKQSESKVGRQSIEERSAAPDLSNPPESVTCFNCNKTFLFANKNQVRMQQKFCKICHRFYCNLQYPPCRKGQEPLVIFQKRMEELTPPGLLLVLQQKFRNLLNRILLRHLYKNEVPYIFLYVLIKEGGFFPFNDQDRVVPINERSCICQLCWPSLATSMVLQFLKYHKEHITTFQRKHLEKAITDVISYFKNRTTWSKLNEQQQTPIKPQSQAASREPPGDQAASSAPTKERKDQKGEFSEQ